MQHDPFHGLQAITFRSHVLTDRLADLTRFALKEWRRAGILDVTTAFVGDMSFDRPGDLAGVTRMLAEDCASANPDNRTFDVLLADHLGGSTSLYCHPDQTDYCEIELTLVRSSDLNLAKAQKFQMLCASFAVALAQHYRVHSARLLPVGPGLACLPHPPLAESPTHLIVVTESAVAEHYDDPSAFWNSGWTLVGDCNAQRVLTRNLDRVSGPDYLKRISDHQWAMARAAKAGETSYESFALEPYEEEVFRSGPARLEFTGYADEERRLDYAGFLAEGQHVQGWEIFALREILQSGQSPNGEAPVDAWRNVKSDRCSTSGAK
jgi:hypothetical protein